MNLPDTNPVLTIRTILHPTDFSACSTFAFDLACSLARHHGAKLVVLYVAGPISRGPSVLPDANEPKQAALEKLNALQMADSKVAISQHIRHGVPAEEIVRLAVESKADVIVMGTHGRTGLARLFAGSVAEAVLRSASCPVLAVRTPLPGTPPESSG